ncbi:protein kinase domain-containing protein, partial [Streptomyces cacaoi]|uniref:protein kinase domain-containing protein n=1 Tax=Streptomyces cacaoi TaxID=1898 RepID=UPI003747DF69
MHGTVLGGRYELRSALGSGGAAEVWEAHDGLLERTVAVKLPYAGGSADAARARAHARFRRAAVLGAQLSGHPHIVPVHDYGHHPGPGPDGADGGREGVPYLVLEHVPGPSLAELIGRPPVVPVARALEWAGQICDALTAVHEAGVVHRDLSPDNVLLSHPYPDLGSALLTDFGLAVRCPDGRSAPAPA